MSSDDKITIEDDFVCLRYKNDTDKMLVIEKEQPDGIIQFHFGLKGFGNFLFNQGTYSFGLNENKYITLYNPQKSLPIHLEIAPHSWVVSILVPIKKFHSLFSSEAEFIPFLNKENQDKKYYSEEEITPSMSIVLNQIMNFHMHTSVKKLYYKGKLYELLSLLFNKSEDGETESCPFITDEENVAKIKQAKDILIEHMTEPPTLQELADAINLSLKKLKVGFKQVYGETVYGFLFDYKMEYARRLLDSGAYNVNEVGIRIGYSTASHFIAAFKKKFGTTPKKYLMSINATV